MLLSFARPKWTCPASVFQAEKVTRFWTIPFFKNKLSILCIFYHVYNVIYIYIHVNHIYYHVYIITCAICNIMYILYISLLYIVCVYHVLYMRIIFQWLFHGAMTPSNELQHASAIGLPSRMTNRWDERPLHRLNETALLHTFEYRTDDKKNQSI